MVNANFPCLLFDFQLCAALVTSAKEHASYGEIMESKEVTPCEDLTDDDIQTAIQNAMGPKSALFVPEVTPKD
ncbi:hypothetical protein RDI58_003466 [Solanum bulbocastanum]|uniref:Uncharacterized protein n=1 Tax=Solanum bulbocastanum TaxID=147425 RepID=A0AAN8YS50_SOLBU